MLPDFLFPDVCSYTICDSPFWLTARLLHLGSHPLRGPSVPVGSQLRRTYLCDDMMYLPGLSALLKGLSWGIREEVTILILN